MKTRGLGAVAFALLLAVSSGAGARLAGAEGASFGAFALLAIGGAAACLFDRCVRRSAWALFAACLGSAGLCVLLESDILALALVWIGAGLCVAFVLYDGLPPGNDATERPLVRFLPTLLILGSLCGLAAWRITRDEAFTQRSPALVLEENAAGDAPRIASDMIETDNPTNAGRIGVELVDPQRYAAALEAAALLLVVALVAALSIARRRAGSAGEAPEEAS